MGALEIVLGSILVALAIALVLCVLAQQGKEKSLSGSITGGAGESFFSKGKGKDKDKVLSKVTTVIVIVFAVLAVAFGIIVAK